MQRSCFRGVFTLWFATAWVLAMFAVALPSSAGSKATISEGAALFSSSGCPQCHGAAGMGTVRAPSLRDIRKQMSPEQTRTQIHDGGKSMPPFGEALTDAQIAALVDFLHAKNGWKLVPVMASK